MTLDVEIRHLQNTREVEKFVQICKEAKLGTILAAKNPEDLRLVLLAFKDGNVVGGLNYFLYPDILLASVDAIAVEQEHERKGVGSLLLEELKKYLRGKNFKMVRAAPLTITLEGFYYKNGFYYEAPLEDYMVHDL